MAEVSDTCRTHSAIVSKVYDCGVRDRLQLIWPIVSKVLCSWNQVYKLSATLHKHDRVCHSSPCLWWTQVDLIYELVLVEVSRAHMRHHAEQRKLHEEFECRQLISTYAAADFVKSNKLFTSGRTTAASVQSQLRLTGCPCTLLMNSRQGGSFACWCVLAAEVAALFGDLRHKRALHTAEDKRISAGQ